MYEKEKLKGKRIAIFGGAGFIGHNLALRFKELGAEPHVVDGLQVNHLGYYTSSSQDSANSDLYIAFLNERIRLLKDNSIPIHVMDIRDYHHVSQKIEEIDPDNIIHLAAIAHANRSNKDPFSTFDHSMRTLENVLDACRSKKRHVIYFSSSMVYGNFEEQKVTEKSICNPLGIYGALKFGAEKLVEAYNQVFEVPFTIIRPSALYGERCVSRRVGQAFIENALNGMDLTINGDGIESLDFTYIDDLCQGVILATYKQEALNEIFNLTFGDARRIIDLANIVMSYFPDCKLVMKPRDSLMPERGTLSIEKAKNLLGYQPQYPIEKGFENYINWYKDFSKSNKSSFK